MSRCLHYRSPTSHATPCIQDDSCLATSKRQDNMGIKEREVRKEEKREKKKLREGGETGQGGSLQRWKVRWTAQRKVCLHIQTHNNPFCWYTHLDVILRGQAAGIWAAPSYLHQFSSQSLSRLDASELLQNRQSADSKHIMISLKEKESRGWGDGGVLLKKKKKPKRWTQFKISSILPPGEDLKNTLLPLNSLFHWHLICSYVWVRGSWMVCE